MAKKSQFSVTRPYAFKGKNFDNQFYRTLSFSSYGGATAGECYAAAEKIKDNDYDSWYAAWLEIADQVAQNAKESLKKGHVISARDAFLRAQEYYRQAEFHVWYDDEPKRFNTWKKSRESFISFLKCSDYSFEILEIPFEDQKLPGYFIKPDKSMKRRPTIVIFGGGDSSGEESYFYCGKAALDRGYNVFQVEGPGQRGTVHLNPGSKFRPDYEVATKVIIDYVLRKEETDPEKLAFYGLSYGGYIVLRAAIFDTPSKAVIANPGWLDLVLFFRHGLPKFTHKWSHRKAGKFAKILANIWSVAKFASTIFMQIYPIKDFSETLEHMSLYNTYGLLDKITCPIFLDVGEGEGDEAFRQQEEILKQVSSKNKGMYQFTIKEGADAHCVTNNLNFQNEVNFNWLDEVFELNR